LRVGDEDILVAAANYTLAAQPSRVREHFGADTFVKMQVLSGALTPAGRRNRYAVKDRFSELTKDLGRLGWRIPMPGGRLAEIEREWAEVRIEAGE
jgi:hypothetical protein